MSGERNVPVYVKDRRADIPEEKQVSFRFAMKMVDSSLETGSSWYLQKSAPCPKIRNLKFQNPEGHLSSNTVSFPHFYGNWYAQIIYLFNNFCQSTEVIYIS